MPVSRGRSGLAVALSRRSCSASLYSLLDRAIRRCGPHLPVSGWDAEADSPSRERRANRAGGRRAANFGRHCAPFHEAGQAQAQRGRRARVGVRLAADGLRPGHCSRWHRRRRRGGCRLARGRRCQRNAAAGTAGSWHIRLPCAAAQGPAPPGDGRPPATFLDAAGLWPRWIGGACPLQPVRLVCAAIRCCSRLRPPRNARRRHGRGGGGFRVECSGIPRQSTAAAWVRKRRWPPRVARRFKFRRAVLVGGTRSTAPR